MKRIITVLCMLILIGMTSCKKELKTDDTQQMKEVIAIHDELMPKMNVIGNLITQLNSSPDSLKHQTAVNDLKDAHESMMNWMQGFGDRFTYEEILEGKTLNKEKQELLDKEEQLVKALETKMLKSIENAKALLKE